ncbi:hypothetical protein DL95DRAFT_408308 [Leptodontidium sp. 2 PMI_412]|nr:hypothetical protein DL95DRAFT_408308 [Leptodontidium sp. 2 PMI_412]
MAQVNPFASIAWGWAQILLESANNSYGILAPTAEIFEDFTKTLPRCSEYIALFPHHPRLQETLQDVCKITSASYGDDPGTMFTRLNPWCNSRPTGTSHFP